MDFVINVLDESEKIIYELRTLYSRNGFERYRMSKFEEYDLYSRNKDFLVSDSIITFTDTNGKLMALKPDVTLSIIKNNKDRPGGLQKLYYNENVYRVSKGTNSFKEIMQTGLECLGGVDNACISQVLMLAARSLACVSSEFVLEISDLEILSAFVNRIPVTDDKKKEILKCFGEKNAHEISRICREQDAAGEYCEALLELLHLYGSPDDVIEKLRKLCRDADFTEKGCIDDEVERLVDVITVFRDSPYRNNIIIDFSAVSDMNYYNGIIFRGFISGIPDGVLSGGQYDRLMKKMGRKSAAIGFAVYLDKLHGSI